MPKSYLHEPPLKIRKNTPKLQHSPKFSHQKLSKYIVFQEDLAVFAFPKQLNV